MNYFLIEYSLGWRNPDGVILRCVNKEEADKLVVDHHLGYYGGHFVAHTSAHKILIVGYYWPTIFFDMHQYIKSCQPFQLFVGKQCLPPLTLKSVVI